MLIIKIILHSCISANAYEIVKTSLKDKTIPLPPYREKVLGHLRTYVTFYLQLSAQEDNMNIVYKKDRNITASKLRVIHCSFFLLNLKSLLLNLVLS